MITFWTEILGPCPKISVQNVIIYSLFLITTWNSFTSVLTTLLSTIIIFYRTAENIECIILSFYSHRIEYSYFCAIFLVNSVWITQQACIMKVWNVSNPLWISLTWLEYINNHPDFNMEIHYTTLSKYFDALGDYLAEHPDIKFGVYYGDFFPYADNEDSYWTVRLELDGNLSRVIIQRGQHWKQYVERHPVY